MLIILIGLSALTASIIIFMRFYFNAGIAALFIGSFLIIIYGIFFNVFIKMKWLNCAILLSIAAAVGLVLFIYFYGKNDNATYKEDSVIVFGAAVRGEAVSTVLAERLKKAVEYYQANPNVIIVVSGGQGPNEAIPEALAMERYLVRKGVPIENIIKEANSSNTYENLKYSKELLDEFFDRPYSTVMITSDFHTFRAVSLAKKLGYDATHLGSIISSDTAPMSYFRECLAVVKMWVLGR